MHICISSCEKNRNGQPYLYFATTDECHHPLIPTYNRQVKRICSLWVKLGLLCSWKEKWLLLRLKAHFVPFGLTQEMGKRFLENSINLGQYVYLEGALACVFAGTLLPSYPIYSEQLHAFLLLFSQLILTSDFPSCILAVGCVGGQTIKSWFFQSWNYLVSVHCIFLFLFSPSYDLMVTCDFGLQIFFGTMSSALTFNHAPYRVDLF